MATVRQLALMDLMTDGDYRYPPWITRSDAEVVDPTFSPCYDRTAICVFVRIDVETVTEPNDLIAHLMVGIDTTGVVATRRCLLSNRDADAIETINTTFNNEQ